MALSDGIESAVKGNGELIVWLTILGASALFIKNTIVPSLKASGTPVIQNYLGSTPSANGSVTSAVAQQQQDAVRAIQAANSASGFANAAGNYASYSGQYAGQANLADYAAQANSQASASYLQQLQSGTVTQAQYDQLMQQIHASAQPQSNVGSLAAILANYFGAGPNGGTGTGSTYPTDPYGGTNPSTLVQQLLAIH